MTPLGLFVRSFVSSLYFDEKFRHVQILTIPLYCGLMANLGTFTLSEY